MKKILLLLIACYSVFSCTPSEDPSTKIDVEMITLSDSEVTLEVGQTIELTAVVTPKEATDKTLTWSIDDDKVLSKDEELLVFTALAPGTAIVTAKAANGVKAECVVTVSSEDGDKRPIEFISVYTTAILDDYKEPLYHWSLDFMNEEARESSNSTYGQYTEKGYGIELDFYLTSQSYTYEFPTGDFEVISAANDDADSKIRVKYIKYGTGGSRVETILTEGSVKITKDDNGKFEVAFDVCNSSIEYKKVIDVDTKEPTQYSSYNLAYMTTIAEDLISNGTEFTQVSICRSETNADSYELFMATEGVTLTPSGSFSGEGQFIQLWLTADEVSGNPNGTYTLKAGKDIYSKSDGEFTATAGVLSPFASNYGCWWLDIVTYEGSAGTARRNISAVPMINGTIEIEVSDLDTDSDYKSVSVKILAEDDKLPTSNNIEISFEGETFYYDRYETGDFRSSGGEFFGIYGNEQDENNNWFYYSDHGAGDNTNWYIRMPLGESILNSNSLANAEIAIDMMAAPTAQYLDGVPDGTYTVDMDRSYDEMTIFNSVLWTYDSTGEPIAGIKATSGSVTFERKDDGTGRYDISVDITYENGKHIQGKYKGNLLMTNGAEVPYSDHVFNGENAQVDITYMGQVGGKSNWAIEMLEDSAVDDNNMYGSGLILSFDLMLEDHPFEDGVPTGRFDLYDTLTKEEGEDKIEVDDPTKFGICNNYNTFYQYLYQTAGHDKQIGWTTGEQDCYIVITKNGENNYTIELDMHSQAFTDQYIDFATTGTYTGEVNLGELASSGNSAMGAPIAPAESKERIFSKYNK